MTILCDGQLVTNIIEEFGVDVTIRQVTKTFDADVVYGDATETYTDTATKAYITTYTKTDDEVKEGIYMAGDIVMYFKGDYSVQLVPGNRIQYNSIWYVISRVSPLISGTVNYAIEVQVKNY